MTRLTFSLKLIRVSLRRLLLSWAGLLIQSETKMDTLTICDLAVVYQVGVPEEERAQPQRLLLTVEIAGDFAGAAAADDLAKTIDYSALSHRLLKFGEGRQWKLIETLAVDIAEMLRSEFCVQRAAVEVKKFVISEARYVSARVVRPRSD